MSDHIEKAPWSDFFADFAESHQTYEARLTISGQSHDHQDEIAWLPLVGITYDPYHNELCVMVGDLNSQAARPRRHTVCTPLIVHVRHTPEGDIGSIFVVTPDMDELMVSLRRIL